MKIRIWTNIWFTGEEKHRDGVGIIVDKKLKENVVDIKRLDDIIIGIKLVLEKDILNIIIA